MNRKMSVFTFVIVLALLTSVSGVIAQEQGPQSPQSALGTVFTYQGQLKNASGPINGNCDFQFSLWDAVSGGTSLASDLSRTNVAVNNGLFTTPIDFGVNAFDGNARWLEISVKCPTGSGTYATLAPRQPLTPAPYALYSTSTSALQGRSIMTTTPTSGQVLKWNGSVWSPADDAIGAPGSGDISGVYAGNGLTGGGASGEVTLTVAFGGNGSASTAARSDHTHSGVDITSGTINQTYIDPIIARDSEITPTVWLNGGTGSGLDADLLDGQHAGSFQQHAQNVLVVAKSGGDYTTITAALNSITSNSATNHYLIYVAPGVYTETVTMKPYVDIEGAGELATRITYTGSGSDSTGTVIGASNAELRFLTAENTGGNSYAYAIYNYASSPRLTHVTATASGGTSYNVGVVNFYNSPAMTNVSATASGGTSYNIGVYNDSSSPTMTNVSATASGGTDSYGVYNEYSSSPAMINVSASASGGTNSYGVINFYNSSPAMTNVSATASGGTNSFGVYNTSSSSPAMTNVIATASGGTDSCGVYNFFSSSPTMTTVSATASGGTNSYGVYNSFSSPTMMNVTATASGGTNNYGMWNNSSSPTIQNSVISALGTVGWVPNDGLHNVASSGSYTVTINNSQITGNTSTIYQDSHYTTRLGASQLIGSGVQGSGSYLCAFSYNGSYATLSSSCH